MLQIKIKMQVMTCLRIKQSKKEHKGRGRNLQRYSDDNNTDVFLKKYTVSLD